MRRKEKLSFFDGSNRLVIHSALALVGKGKQRKLVLITIVQALLSLLDMLSVAIIGLLTSIALTGIRSQQTSGISEDILAFLRLSEFSFQVQVALLGLTAAGFMILKTVFSAFMIDRILMFLAITASNTSRALMQRLHQEPWEFIKQLDSQKTLFSLTTGVYALIIGVLGSTAQIVTELSLLIIMLFGLMFVDQGVTAGAILFFSLVMILQNRLLSKKSRDLSSEHAKFTVETNTQVLSIFKFYRELYTRNAIAFSVDKVGNNLNKAMRLNAKLKFLPNISRYVMEVALVVGALVLATTQFIVTDAISAITILTIFLAAASRIAPSLIRLQTAIIGFNSAVGGSTAAIELLAQMSKSKIREIEPIATSSTSKIASEDQKSADIEFKGVSFGFADEEGKQLYTDIDFKIERGKFVAIVGPSGSGKTTLIDLMLGLYTPTEGRVCIRGRNPQEIICSSPNLISYVPQESYFFNSSILDNLTMRVSDLRSKKHQIYQLLKTLKLDSLTEPNGSLLDLEVGENAALLSGGQRQRLVLARALVVEPSILILDEATSALDYETEKAVIDYLQTLKGKVTIIAIAHRISTILHADEILYLSAGKLEVSKSLNELKSKVPGIEQEATLISSAVFDS